MVSLAAVEEVAMHRWPDGQHAAVSLDDTRKGEQIVLLTDVEGADRGDFVESARHLQISELALPKRIVVAETVPLLGSGKVDYAAVKEVIFGDED